MAEQTQVMKKRGLSEFLKDEITRNRKATKATWIIGIIVLFLVTLYMHGLVVLVRGMLEPVTAARMIGMNVEESLPLILTETEKSLKDQAIPLANALSNRLTESLPKLRKEGERQIDLTHKEFLPLLREEMRSGIRDYMLEHTEEINELFETHKGPEFAELFVDTIMSDMATSLESELWDGCRTNNLEHIKANSLKILNDINEELLRLINMSDTEMTRSDRLQRRLIVIWVKALDELLDRKCIEEPSATQ